MKKTFFGIFGLVIALTVSVVPARVVAYAKVTGNPTNLFDIVFSVDSALIDRSNELVTRTQFTSFGTEPTQVNLIYRVEDNSGKVVYSENGEVRVETEQTVTKKFNDLNIGSGKYTVYLHTKYGNNVEDEFHRSILVRAAPVFANAAIVRIGIIAGLIITGGLGIYAVVNKKMRANKKAVTTEEIPWTNLREGKIT